MQDEALAYVKTKVSLQSHDNMSYLKHHVVHTMS